jgi:hypothetical protein
MKGGSRFLIILGIIFVILGILFKMAGFSKVSGVPIMHIAISPDSFHQFGQTLLLLGLCFNFWQPKAIESGEKKEE